MEFSITSLDAFDELMNQGYCVELKDTSSAIEGFITKGSRVELYCTASLWDGAATGKYCVLYAPGAQRGAP